MKNYPDVFNETYDEFFEQYKKKHMKKKILKSTIIFFVLVFFCSTAGIIGIALSDYNHGRPIIDDIMLYLTDKTLLGIVVSICLTLTITVFKPVVYTHNIYEKKATEFATTIYLDDVIVILKKKFILSPEFEDKLKIVMNDLYWYDNGFAPGFEFEEFFEEKMTFKGETYYLVGWTDSTLGFLFECKVVKEDQLETVEFLLK